MNKKPTLGDIYTALPKNPVLIRVNSQKAPIDQAWQKTTWEDTQNPQYQQNLKGCPNIGVVLGAPSQNLCSVDCDTDAFTERFLRDNPILQSSFRTRAVGVQVYAYFEGERPLHTVFLRVPKDSPLAAGSRKEPDKNGMVKIGEFRAEGGQSVLCGKHPKYSPQNPVWYHWPVDNPPVSIAFKDLIWPKEVEFGHQSSTNGQEQRDKSEMDLACEAISIDFLWDHFELAPRHGANPVCSPFRNDSKPSFSIYWHTNGQQWFKDHGTGEHGNSFEFYQQHLGLDFTSALDSFLELVEQVRSMRSGTSPKPDLQKTIEQETAERQAWYEQKADGIIPPIAENAFIGFAGEWIKSIEKQTESNRDNLLVQFIVVTGILFGRYFYNYLGWNLFTNLFAVILGDTGAARKGTALEVVKGFIKLIDPNWHGIRANWKSGEAIVHFTRDPSGKKDPGVTDKRILILEGELIHLFKMGERRGNTLTSTLREAWDSPDQLFNTSKGTPAIATGAHIGMIGHMTETEMLTIDLSLISNGMLNRILWAFAFRARKITNPKPIQWQTELIERFKAIYQYAHGPIDVAINSLDTELPTRYIALDEEAQAFWTEYYLETPEEEGNLASICERFLPMVRKIAEIYAIMDRAPAITLPHLKAGFAIADHSKACARSVFSKLSPNSLSNKILAALKRRPEGMTRSQMSKDIGNNRIPSVEFDEALSVLAKNKLAKPKMVRTAGRPAEVWFPRK